METVESLKKRVQELEEQLKGAKAAGAGREKIDKMSSEVVDSNPYR